MKKRHLLTSAALVSVMFWQASTAFAQQQLPAIPPLPVINKSTETPQPDASASDAGTDTADPALLAKRQADPMEKMKIEPLPQIPPLAPLPDIPPLSGDNKAHEAPLTTLIDASPPHEAEGSTVEKTLKEMQMPDEPEASQPLLPETQSPPLLVPPSITSQTKDTQQETVPTEEKNTQEDQAADQAQQVLPALPSPPMPPSSQSAAEEKPGLLDKLLKVVKPSTSEESPAKKTKEKPKKKTIVAPVYVAPVTYRLPSTIYKKHYSRDNEHLPVAHYEGELDAVLFNAAAQDDVRTAQVMLANGRSVNMVNADGEPLLVHAVRYRAAHVVRLLLAKHANVNVYDTQGYTPLQYAQWGNLEEIIALLKDAGV